jgi:hypothetical protein
VQWENWLMGMFFKYLIPTTCISAAFLICLSDRKISTKVLYSGLLATISSFSIANGLLSWLVIFPVLFADFKQLKSNIRLVYAWWFGFGITIICYFWDYRSPSETYSPFHLITHIFDIPLFLSTLIGAPFFASFQNFAPQLAAIGGLILIIFFMFTALIAIPYQKLRVWAMFGSYGLLSALLITTGRIAVGIDQAFVSRYTPFAIPLSVGLIFLWTHSPDITNPESKSPKFENRIYYSLFIIVLSLSLISIYSMGSKMSQLKTERLEAKACLSWMMEVRNEECLLNKVVAKLSVLDQRAQKLSDLGFLHPPLRNNSVLIDNSVAGQEYGWVDRFEPDANGSYLISGWAVLADRPADAIILSYINSVGQAIAFKLIDRKYARVDVAKTLKKSTYLNSGWSTKFQLSDRPNPQIQAWSYDAETGKSYRLRSL